jgi:hypothetical protein
MLPSAILFPRGGCRLGRYGLRRIAWNVAALAEDVDRHDARRARRLDAVIDRVLEQRLQHERRDQRVLGMLFKCHST